MLYNIRGRGFQMVANGVRISIMFGPANYCDNRSHSPRDFEVPYNDAGVMQCATAEMMLWWEESGHTIRPPEGLVGDGAWDCDEVAGWLTADQVGTVIAWVMDGCQGNRGPLYGRGV